MTLLITIVVFLILSAMFSGCEIAFVSANKLGIEVLKDKGSRRGKILASFYDKPKDFISTMLVGNNITLVVFTFLMTKLLSQIFAGFDQDSVSFLVLSTCVSTIIVLLLGEYIPKVFSQLYSNGVLHLMAYPLRIFKWLLFVPTRVMTWISDFILKSVFRSKIDRSPEDFSWIDLENYINEGVSEEDDDIDKDFLTKAIQLRQLKVRDCMIPRTEIVHVDKSDSMKDLLDTFKDFKHSRVLVINGDIENVMGYVHHLQLLDNPVSMRKLIMKMPFIPEAMNIQDLFYRFMQEDTNIACVVDEFGGTAGLITLEDILEEIFGEIEDEHDVEGVMDHQLSEREFLFNGRVEIDHINDKYELINIPNGEYNTLSGYIVMTSGSIPSKGEEVSLDNYTFILESVSDTKIESVRMIVNEDTTTDEPE